MITERVRSVLYAQKYGKDFFIREFHSQINLYNLDKTKQTSNITIHDLFLYFQNLHALKKSDMYLRKIQINFFDKKNVQICI